MLLVLNPRYFILLLVLDSKARPRVISITIKDIMSMSKNVITKEDYKWKIKSKEELENNESGICYVMPSKLDTFMRKGSNALLFSLRTLVRKSVAKSNDITCLS